MTALTIRTYAATKLKHVANLLEKRVLQSVESMRGWWPIIRESWAGAFQADVEISLDNVLTHPTVFACVTLIASDVAKLRLKLVEETQALSDIWEETESAAFSPVLRKPNHYQNRIQFYKLWMISKLVHGNTYALKRRDQRGVVVGLYILDPQRVRPLVAENGDVFYELKIDPLSRQTQELVIIPADEIIHDIMEPLFHPLVGVSPIFACGLAATLGLQIERSGAVFFEGRAIPGGILTVPGTVRQDRVDALKAKWQTEFAGDNVGKVAVLTDGATYTPLLHTAENSSLVDNLKWNDEAIARCFHVPGYMVGVGPLPSYQNIQALKVDYYTGCVQIHYESLETLLDEGLGLSEIRNNGRKLGTEFDLAGLFRMDTATLVDSEQKAVNAGIKSINEARQVLNLPPAKGGDEPRQQQQMFGLEALADRDAADPFVRAPQAAPAPPAAQAEPDRDTAKALLLLKTQQRMRRAAA